MSETSIDKWFPLEIGWYLKASQDWDPSWGGPVLWVMCKMWPDGGKTRNDDRALAACARLPLKKWKQIRDGVGAFFRVDGDFLVQDTLVVKHAENLKKYLGHSNHASVAAKARWEKERLNNAAGNAPSNTPGIAPGVARASLHAIKKERDLDLNLEEEESIAIPVPIATVSETDTRILATLQNFPKSRKLPGGATGHVHIGENAARLAAAFLARNPDYPLAYAAKLERKNDHPKDFANWISDPPARALVMATYEAELKAEADRKALISPFEPATPESLRRVLADISANNRAHRERSLADAASH